MSKKIVSEDDLQKVIARYQERINQHGATFETLESGSLEKQRLRCHVHATALRGTRPSILDIGCGIGFFYSYLTSIQQESDYNGYDIVPEYITACKKLYPEANFELRNFFDSGIDGIFDTIVMSQVLNNRYADSDNMEVMRHTLEETFKHTHVSVSIDMMSRYVDFENPVLFYYSPEEIFTMAKSIAKRVVIRHDYRRFEFCVKLFHDDADNFIP